jgi:tetratricopeptide (TPR) repeat protein
MRVAVVLVFATGVVLAQNAEFDRARELLTAGHPAEAAEIYRELSRAQPNNIDLLVNLTIAEYKAGHFRGALENASAALKLSPDLLPANLFLGASLLELGEFARAIDPLQKVIAANPRERNGRLMLGEALLGAGRSADAVGHFQSAAEMLPANPRVWSGLAKACESAGRKELAEDAWKQLMKLPPSLESHAHAAELNDSALRWREAAIEWQEALKMAPENRKIRLSLAWAQFRSRDYDGAMMTVKTLLAGAGIAEVDFLYGASLLNLQRPAEALPYLKNALARDPKFLPARAAMGQALLQTGRAEDAIPQLRQALTVDQDGSIHFQLFRAYQVLKRDTEAQQALTAYQRLRRSIADSH